MHQNQILNRQQLDYRGYNETLWTESEHEAQLVVLVSQSKGSLKVWGSYTAKQSEM
jgi:hypothetical protein